MVGNDIASPMAPQPAMKLVGEWVALLAPQNSEAKHHGNLSRKDMIYIDLCSIWVWQKNSPLIIFESESQLFLDFDLIEVRFVPIHLHVRPEAQRHEFVGLLEIHIDCNEKIPATLGMRF